MRKGEVKGAGFLELFIVSENPRNLAGADLFGGGLDFGLLLVVTFTGAHDVDHLANSVCLLTVIAVLLSLFVKFGVTTMGCVSVY